MELSKVKFMVDEKNRVVTATIRDISSDAIKTFNKKFLIHAGNDFNLSINSDKYQKFMMPDYLKVVVHCHPDDTFDEKIGKRIASDRLIDKYHSSLNKHMLNIADAVYKCLYGDNGYFNSASSPYSDSCYFVDATDEVE